MVQITLKGGGKPVVDGTAEQFSEDLDRSSVWLRYVREDGREVFIDPGRVEAFWDIDTPCSCGPNEACSNCAVKTRGVKARWKMRGSAPLRTA